MPRLLRQIKVRDLGPSQSEAVESSILTVGERGIKRLTELDDMRVEVVGDRSTFIHWTNNISWAVVQVAPPSEGDPPLPNDAPQPAILSNDEKQKGAVLAGAGGVAIREEGEPPPRAQSAPHAPKGATRPSEAMASAASRGTKRHNSKV